MRFIFMLRSTFELQLRDLFLSIKQILLSFCLFVDPDLYVYKSLN